MFIQGDDGLWHSTIVLPETATVNGVPRDIWPEKVTKRADCGLRLVGAPVSESLPDGGVYCARCSAESDKRFGVAAGVRVPVMNLKTKKALMPLEGQMDLFDSDVKRRNKEYVE